MSEKNISSKRPSELGMLLVISGPGGSGSTTISNLVEKKYNLSHYYAGDIFRDLALKKGFKNLEDFLKDVDKKDIDRYDLDVDNLMIQKSQEKDVLIEGKAFAALASIKNIPCTLKVWLDADLNTRVLRVLSRDGILKYGEPLREELMNSYSKVKDDLVLRSNLLDKRLKELYGIEYDRQELYNDIVIDSSNQSVEETFNLICKYIDSRMAQMIDNGNKSVNDVLGEDFEICWKRWKCLVCGYLFEGVDIEKRCPKCGNADPDKFIDVD